MYNTKHSLSPHGRSASIDDKNQESSHTHRYGRDHRIGSTARDLEYPHRSKSPDRGGRNDQSRSPNRKQKYHGRSKSPDRGGRYYQSRSPNRKERYHDRSKSPGRDGRYIDRSRNRPQDGRSHTSRDGRSHTSRDGRSYTSRSPIRKERYHYHIKSPVQDERYPNPISRSPVSINRYEFYEKSSVGECDIGSFKPFEKVESEDNDGSISGCSEKEDKNIMSHDDFKENVNYSSGCINEKVINSMSKGDSKNESVDGIMRDINENVKISNENKTDTEDKRIDATEDCNSACSNELTNDCFEKRNIQEDLSSVSDRRLSEDLHKQNYSETSVINTENMAPEIIQEINKENDPLLDKRVQTESMEFTYESLERSDLVESMIITDKCFERKIPNKATKTVENCENNPQVIVSNNCNEQIAITLSKDESKGNCGIESEGDIISNKEETSPKNKSGSFLGQEDCSPSSVDARVHAEALQIDAIENYEKEQQVIDNKFLDQSTFSENIDVPCSSKEGFIRQDKNAVSMDIEVTREVPVVNDELFYAEVKSGTLVAVSQKKKQVTKHKNYAQNQGDKNVTMKDIDILKEITKVKYGGIIKTESMSSTKNQNKKQDVDSNGIEQHAKFIHEETPYQMSFYLDDDSQSTIKKCCVKVDGNWYIEMKKKEYDQRGYDEPICTIKDAARPFSRNAMICLKKPVSKTTKTAKFDVMKPVPKNAKTSVMKPVLKIPKIAKTCIVKPVQKIPEIPNHRFAKLVDQKVETDDKKPEMEIEHKFYNNCEVTKAIAKVLKVEPVVLEDETTDKIGDMKIRPCSDCPKRFSNASTIVVHREVHSGPRIMKCNFCSFTGNRTSMLMHTRAKHTQEKLFECDFCKKRFASCATKKSHENNCCS